MYIIFCIQLRENNSLPCLQVAYAKWEQQPSKCRHLMHCKCCNKDVPRKP